MKMKIKALAAAAALAAGGHASAALSDFFVDNSQLMLTVWNAIAPQQSYTRDLGVTLDQFLASPSSAGFTTGDPLFASTFAGVSASNIRFTLIGYDQVADANGYRIAATFASFNPLQPVLTSFDVQQIANYATDFAFALNTNGCDVAISCASTGLGATYGGGTTWGSTYGGQSNGAVSNGTGFGSVNFYSLLGGDTGSSGVLATQSLLGSFSLATDGSVSFTAAGPVNPVPLPAAAWMFGAGLLSLAGVVRRRRAAAE